MMSLMPENRIDWLTRNAPFLIILGIALVMNAVRNHGPGISSAMHLMSLGGFAALTREWRREPGIWMLATFFGVFYGALWTLHQWGTLNDIFKQRKCELAISIDASISMSLMATMVWMLFSIAVLNWRCFSTRPQRRGQ